MAVPEIKTPLPGPKAQAIIDRDAVFVSSSYTRAYPLVTAQGEGSVIEDVDGNRFLDCAAGIAVATTGHSHPDVVRAVVEQAGRYLHVAVADFYAEGVVRLAEALAPILPIDGGVRCFFSNSGTEAVEAALKLARYHTKRPYLIAFLGAFHGRTMGSLAMTASRASQRRGFAPLMAGVYHAPYAECYRCPLNLKPESCEAECLDFVEEQLLMHLVAPAQFLQRLVEIAQRYGMLLVMDEVQSGMGRTGKMFACEHADVRPDIVVIAKGIASGMPLGITAARADVMNWPPGAHASTFGGNPVSCAAALVTIKMVREQLMANAAAVGAHLLAGLRRLAERHPLIGDVRGRGLMIGIELVRDRQTKERADTERDALVMAAFRRGLLTLGAGRNVVRLSPPLVLTQTEADTALELLDEAFTEVEVGTRP